jgi:hypothetical protein
MRMVMVMLGLTVGGLTLMALDAPPESTRSPEAQAKLDKWLGGRIAGEHRSCLQVDKTGEPIGIDDNIVLFRDGPRIWRNDVKRSFDCGTLNRQSTIISESAADRLCNGDKLVFSNGATDGACELGDFVRYDKP